MGSSFKPSDNHLYHHYRHCERSIRNPEKRSLLLPASPSTTPRGSSAPLSSRKCDKSDAQGGSAPARSAIAINLSQPDSALAITLICPHIRPTILLVLFGLTTIIILNVIWMCYTSNQLNLLRVKYSRAGWVSPVLSLLFAHISTISTISTLQSLLFVFQHHPP